MVKIEFKEWLSIFGFFIAIFILGSPSKSYPYFTGTQGNMDGYHVWVDSSMGDNSVVSIATPSLILHQVKIESTGTATCGLFNTAVRDPIYNHFVTSFSMTDAAREPNYDLFLSSGLLVNCVGSSANGMIGRLTVLFDWVYPSSGTYGGRLR